MGRLTDVTLLQERKLMQCKWIVGGSYCTFAGKECARALALMKVEADECNDNLEDLTEKDLKVLDDWIKKFQGKYSVVGKVKVTMCMAVIHMLIALNTLENSCTVEPPPPLLLNIGFEVLASSST